jgi:hypothetical protein
METINCPQMIEVLHDQGQVVYHVARTSVRSSIEEQGLNVELGETPWPENHHSVGNYFWKCWTDAEEYVHTVGEVDQEYDIWQVETSQLNLYHDPEEFDEEHPSYICIIPVAPSKLKLDETVTCLDWEDRYH